MKKTIIIGLSVSVLLAGCQGANGFVNTRAENNQQYQPVSQITYQKTFEQRVDEAVAHEQKEKENQFITSAVIDATSVRLKFIAEVKARREEMLSQISKTESIIQERERVSDIAFYKDLSNAADVSIKREKYFDALNQANKVHK